MQGKSAQSEPFYLRALAIFEEVSGPGHPHVGASLNNLAELYRDQGKYEAAAPLYQRALTIFEAALGPGHPRVAITLNNLAELYRAQRNYDWPGPSICGHWLSSSGHSACSIRILRQCSTIWPNLRGLRTGVPRPSLFICAR